jgi:hypothetical protein
MGRPRKRRFVEDPALADNDASGEEIVSVPARDAGTGPVAQDGPGAGVGAGAGTIAESIPPWLVPLPPDQGLGFLDESSTPNFDFLDLLPSAHDDVNQIDPQILVPGDGAVDGTGFPFALNGGVDLLQGINFDEPDTSTIDMSKALSDSLQRHWASNPMQGAPEPPESYSSGLSQSAGSPASHSGLSSTTTHTGGPDEKTDKEETATLKALPSIACGCLSSLYLALDSLSRIPDDIPSAMRVARNATKIAHDVIKCPYCSDSLNDDPTQPPPIQSLQNLMCLAALVPSACNAYAVILTMLDKGTAAAKEDGRTIWFSFKEMGGLFGALDHEHDDCTQYQSLNNQWLQPDVWRTTMRAILRLDVYGFGSKDMAQGAHGPALYQNGLKDVVRLLEERSKRRHDKMDKMAAEGKTPHTHYAIMPQYRPMPPEQRHCMVVLEAARVALENLVIA